MQNSTVMDQVPKSVQLALNPLLNQTTSKTNF